MNSIFTSKARGFTLLEILVVMAIIGILASIITVALTGGRNKGRDARRVADIKNLQVALNSYLNANDTYPSVGTDDTGYAITTLQTALVPAYLPKIPQDPLYPGVSAVAGDYQYVRGPSGLSYGIWVYLETAMGGLPAGSRCVIGKDINSVWFTAPPKCPF